MVVKVHVWLPNETHVGHAALTIGDDHISFWPGGGADKKDLKIKRSQRVDINIPLRPGTSGRDYLSRLSEGLAELSGSFRLAFVVAGTDVLASDPLGGLGLSIDDCVVRDRLVLERLQALSVPAVFVGGGGYGRDSAKAIVASIGSLCKR